MLWIPNPLSLKPNLQIARILHDLLKLLRHQLQLLQQLFGRWILSEFDGLHQGLCELLAHDVQGIHLEIRVSYRDQVGDDLVVQLLLYLQKGTFFPLAHLSWKFRLKFCSGGNHSNPLKRVKKIWRPLCCAVFDPAAHGIGDDEGLPHSLSQFQKFLRRGFNVPEISLDIGRQHRFLVAKVQKGRAQQGVVPIENDHRLMLR
eukprot:Skav208887  [mRNA]  locus=scaffold270:355795:362000:+ [translate_table: standard]